MTESICLNDSKARHTDRMKLKLILKNKKTMKAKYIIISFAALAIMAGCSKTKTEAQPDPVTGPDDEWVTDETLPVPVNFSAPQIGVVSKASAEQVDQVAGLAIGVFGIKTISVGNPISRPQAEDHPIQDDLSSDATYITGMKNVKAIVNDNADLDGKTYITFKDAEDADEIIYYPMTSDNTYSFYAYYPYNATDVSYTENECTVEFELGTDDILWAEDHAQSFQNNTREGFNAAYVRQVADPSSGVSGNDNFRANLNFTHRTTGFRFYALAEEGADYENLTVTGLRLKNIATKATLYVAASQSSEYNSGDLVAAELDVDENNNVITLTDPDNDNSDTFSVVPTRGTIMVEDEEKIVGAEIGTLLVCPVASETIPCTLEVDIIHNGESSTLTAPLPARATGYVASTMYSLSVLIKSPEEIEIFVGLEDWDNIVIEKPIEVE